MKIEFKNAMDEVTLKLYDYVGKDEGVNVEVVEEQLKQANNKPLSIHINSNGGEVFEGFAIYNLIKDYKGIKTVYIDGIAASIASVIAMSANKIIMSKASMMMIHNASGLCYGTSDEMKQLADALEQINEVIKSVYLQRVNISKDELTDLMNQEKFLTPEDCLKYGFCDEILDDKQDEEVEEIKTVALNELLNVIEQRTATLNSLKNAQKVANPKNKTKDFLRNYLRKENL